VRAFSLTSCITQCDGGAGRGRAGQPHPPAPRRPGTAPADSTATFRLTCDRVDGLERGQVADLRCRGCRWV